MGVELPVTAAVVQCALRGIARAHVTAGTPRRVRPPVPFDILLAWKILIPAWSPEGKVFWVGLNYILMTRSDELSATDSGAVYPVHFLTRGDVALYASGTQLEITRWQQADKAEVWLKGHKVTINITGKRTRADSKRSAGAQGILQGGRRDRCPYVRVDVMFSWFARPGPPFCVPM